ncbi:MAG: methylenetetrahydrofolate reductase [NAD(P)H] [Paludibacteraceae bacterium]|nr:methylenetetrahydrofolate reductase [NAD(P)H] [Candidatus Physcocola equi]MCQ2234415.1 methylenetetrahydrofolate reductase [NAD(P)H] [Paludibacteraceae bacterium]
MILDAINNGSSTAFSFEVCPPIKGRGLDSIYSTIDLLREFDPKYINITTHRSELVYRNTSAGLFEGVTLRRRPGTVAIAAAIKNKYHIDVVPHILCSGFSKEETEYVLIDLDYLGIHDLLVLRGDKAPQDKRFTPDANGHSFAVELQDQINKFNEGFFVDGTPIDYKMSAPFTYGVAGYPEKHEEAPNFDFDIANLKRKVENGAKYIVTQMFFDNEKFYSFVDRCRMEGINVPVIPGLKPISKVSQLSVLAKTFHVDLPTDLVNGMMNCKSEADMRAFGVEWCVAQAKDLIKHGVPSIHFYSINATKSVAEVAKQVY